MAETKIIKAVFGAVKSIITQPRYRYDYGQVIEVSGITLPEHFEARFSNAPTGESVRVLGQNQRVAVPDELLRTGKSVWCYITVHDAVTDGRTMYTIRIPIKDATERTDAEPTPVQQDVIEQAIAALNAAVEKTAQDVESADASAQSAKADADRAETARDTAEGHAQQAQTSASNASASAQSAASSASASAHSASTAQQMKVDVQGLVSYAQSAAGASAQSALESSQSASQASASATSASQSAETASTKASEASASAQTAGAKATEASGYASTASQKASESSQSASSASGYATQAGQAKTAAETAQGLAESARDSAISAKNDAESARDDAETARDEAQSAVASISGALAEKAPVITDTASGSVASFSDGANAPVKSLIVNIDPVQSGSGDPSPDNVRPISGWSEVNVQRTGKNLWEPFAKTSGFLTPPKGSALPALSVDYSSFSNDVLIVNAPSGWIGNGFISNPLLVGKTYSITGSIDATTPRVQISVLDDKKMVARNIQNLTTTGDFSITVTIATGERYIAIALVDASNGHIEVKSPCISESGDYEPYSGTSLTIQLGQTVYGGTLDVLSGELVIDMAMVDLGTLNWQSSSTTASSTGRAVQTTVVLTKSTPSSAMSNLLCTQYATDKNDAIYRGKVGICATLFGYFKIFDTAFLGLSDVQVKALLSGVYACYELATPITIQLTPNQVNSLLGVNNLWADSGDTEVEYRADTKLYIAKKIAEAIASLT